MKTLSYLFIVLATIVSSCSSTNQAVKNTSDDVYYSSKDAKAEREAKKAEAEKQAAAAQAAPAQSAAKTSTDGYTQTTNTSENNTSQSSDDYYDPNAKTSSTTTSGGNTYVTNNYNDSYDADDYYDYQYSSRIRRFHSPSTYWGYYDPFYTNTYFYNYTPSCYGTSIYMGYNFWSPSYTTVIYNTGFVWGNSWGGYSNYGYGYNNLWNDPWAYGYYNPYSYGYGYGGYNHGYNNGYANGYWDGYHNGAYNSPYYYYNSYEKKNTYYGPRNATASNGHRGSDVPATFGDHFERENALTRGHDLDGRKPTTECPKGKDMIKNEVDNTGRPHNLETPGKGKVNEVDNTGRPNNNVIPSKGKTNDMESVEPKKWTTKDETIETPTKGKTTEVDNTGRPNPNWNSENTPKTNNAVDEGRPRHNEVIENPKSNNTGETPKGDMGRPRIKLKRH